jgi:hypothetical protein
MFWESAIIMTKGEKRWHFDTTKAKEMISVFLFKHFPSVLVVSNYKHVV